MGASSLSKRYALGLIKALKSEAEYSAVKSQLERFQQLMDADPEFRAGLVTPMLSREQKEELLGVVRNRAGFETKTMNFLGALAEENRLEHLGGILAVLDDMWLDSRGIEKLQVSSVVPLNDTQRSRLESKLGNALGKPVQLEFSIDPSLIAGIRIERGSVAYDLSIAGNLRKLYRRIVGAGSGADSPVNSPQEL